MALLLIARHQGNGGMAAASASPDPRLFLQTFSSRSFRLQSSQSLASPGQVGCIAPRLTNADGSSQPSVGRFPTIRSLICDQFRPRPLRKYQSPQPSKKCAVDWASGACLFRSSEEAFAPAWGGFDEPYFLYMEEVDLRAPARCRACVGFRAGPDRYASQSQCPAPTASRGPALCRPGPSALLRETLGTPY